MGEAGHRRVHGYSVHRVRGDDGCGDPDPVAVPPRIPPRYPGVHRPRSAQRSSRLNFCSSGLNGRPHAPCPLISSRLVLSDSSIEPNPAK